MILVKKNEIMFDDHVVKQQAHLDKKNSDFT